MGSSRFSEGKPFKISRQLAKKYDCDLAIPNGSGVGNVLAYTRLVESMAKKKNARLRILTAPLNPTVGKSSIDTDLYPVWQSNPYIESIVNILELEEPALATINKEKDDMAHIGHVVSNLCIAYDLKATTVTPQLFLSAEEVVWALDVLSNLKRPIVALHPFGKTSSLEDTYWHSQFWQDLRNLDYPFSYFQLGLPFKEYSLRQTMALIWASDCFIGFDSSLAHIATSFHKKNIVLWDAYHKEPIETEKERGFSASMMSRWAYDTNLNLVLLGGRSEHVFGVCQRHLEQRLL
jgi:hypothetical protein